MFSGSDTELPDELLEEFNPPPVGLLIEAD
jgi:hypothetical protein